MMVVKKEAEHPRVLPSLEHMKIVSEMKSDIFPICIQYYAMKI